MTTILKEFWMSLGDLVLFASVWFAVAMLYLAYQKLKNVYSASKAKP